MGKKLTPVFDLFLRTTDKLEISVKTTVPGEYTIKTTNLSMPLPLEIVTNEGTKILVVNNQGIKIKSSVLPAIDPRMFYLKKLTIE